MKSTEFYRIVREMLGGWCREQEFQRTRGSMLGWFRPLNRGFLVFWFQVDKYGWDAHAGSKFTLEFQRSSKPGIAEGDFQQRVRLPELFPVAKLEQARRMQNSVIKSLVRPGEDNWIYRMPKEIIECYLKDFELLKKGRVRRNDFWFRYFTQAHVEMWVRFIGDMLPDVIERISEFPARKPLEKMSKVRGSR